MSPRLLIAAHGTKSQAGLATTRAIAAVAQTARTDLDVSLCFLDVATPSLATALESAANMPTVVVPLVLSCGFHILSDLPSVVEGTNGVQVARHLGPDPRLADVVAEHFREAVGAGAPASAQLLALGSTRAEAREEVAMMARLVSDRIGLDVQVVAVNGEYAPPAPGSPPFAIATYLIAEGTLYERLHGRLSPQVPIAQPIGAHPTLIELVLERYDEAVA